MIAAGAYLDEDLLLASLWTGDLGVALFASDCLDGRARYPVLETWG